MVANNVSPKTRPAGPARPLDIEQEGLAEIYPFAPHFVDVGTSDAPTYLHYVDEGPEDGPVVVMLHGNPTWSFMYRRLVQALSPHYRCIAVDHMGCGLSDRPQDYPYTLEKHAENLRKLLASLGIEKYHLVMHDWGGMIGSTAAAKALSEVQSVTVLNTAAFLGRLPKRIRTVRIPGFGKTAVLGFNAFVRAALRMCVEKPERLTKDIVRGFVAPYRSWHDRIATLRFVEDVPLSPDHPTHSVVEKTDGVFKTFEGPVLCCWGMHDWCFTPEFLDGWIERFPRAQVHRFHDAGHYILEDIHEKVIPLVRGFLDENEAGRQPAASLTSPKQGGPTHGAPSL